MCVDDDFERAMDELNELSKDINAGFELMDDFIRDGEYWDKLYDSLIKEEDFLHSSFIIVLDSLDKHSNPVSQPILRLHFIGLVSAYEVFVRGFFNSMIAHDGICNSLIKMINDDGYRHSENMMRLSKFKGCNSREALNKSFYNSSFSDASRLSATLAQFFELNVSLPEQLNGLIIKRNVYVHNAGLDIDGNELTLSLCDIEQCHDILINASHCCIEAVREKSVANSINN